MRSNDRFGLNQERAVSEPRNDDAKRAKKRPSEVSDAASEGLFHYEFSKDRNNMLLSVFALSNPVYFFFVRI